MKEGTVKFFRNDRNFGFIIDNLDKKEYFVHSSGLKEKVETGDQVVFETEETPKGLSAINVRKI